MLHQKQQQELKHHYKRQMILNPNHKINPVQVPSKEMGVPPGSYGRYADEMARKVFTRIYLLFITHLPGHLFDVLFIYYKFIISHQVVYLSRFFVCGNKTIK